MLQNFQSVFYHFGTLCIEYLKAKENVSKGSFFLKLGFKASFPQKKKAIWSWIINKHIGYEKSSPI